MNIKKITAILLSLIMLLTVFTSCGENKTVMTVAGYEMPYHLYRYMVINARTEIEKQYGEDVWDSDKAAEAEAELEANIKNAIASVYTVIALGEEYGLKWDEGAVNAEAKMERDQAKLEFEDEDEFMASLQSNYMTEDTFMFLISNTILNNEIYFAMVDSNEDYSNKDRMIEFFKSDEVIRVKQILVGGENAGTPEENQKKAQEIKERLDAGEDFDIVSKEYNNDLFMFENDDGYYIMKGTRDVNFEAAAFALEIGEISEVVETAAGYCIIKRYEKEDSYIEANYDTLIDEYLESLYTAKYEKKFTEILDGIGDLPDDYDILTLK